MNNYEKGMVKSMTQTLSMPLFNLTDDYIIDDLIKMKDDLKLDYKGKLSILPFLIKSFSLSLLKFPKLNSLYYPSKNEYSYEIH